MENRIPLKIYVDIDGTLTVETEGFGDEVYRSRTPRHEIINRVNQLFDQGNPIVLWTSRKPIDRKVTIEWLKTNGVKFNKLILGKPTYDLYVCDKAMNVDDFRLIFEKGI